MELDNTLPLEDNVQSVEEAVTDNNVPDTARPIENSVDTDFRIQRETSNDPKYHKDKMAEQAFVQETEKEGNEWWEDVDKGIFGTGEGEGIVYATEHGLREAINGTHKFIGFGMEYFNDKLGDEGVLRDVDEWLRGGKFTTKDVAGVDFTDNIVDELPPPTTVTGQFISGAAQFMPLFVNNLALANKVTKGASFFAQGLKQFPKAVQLLNASAAGFATDFVVRDPDDPNISNIIPKVFGRGKGQELLEEYLGTSPGNTEAENRFRNGVEGMFIGVFADLGIKFSAAAIKTGAKQLSQMINKVRGSKSYKATAETIAQSKPVKAVQEATTPKPGETAFSGATDDATKAPVGKLSEGEKAAAKDAAKEEVMNEAARRGLAKDGLKAQRVAQEIHFKMENGKKVLKETSDYKVTSSFKQVSDSVPIVKINKEQITQAMNRINKGDLAAADDFIDINLNRTESSEHFDQIINTTSEVIAPHLKDAKISNEMVGDMAKHLGISLTEADDMFRNVVSNNMKAKFLAMRNMLQKTADDLFNKATLAQNGGMEATLEMRKAMVRHMGLQKQVSGIKTEIARTLQAMRITAKAENARMSQLDSLITSFGGQDANATFAKRLVMLRDSPGGVEAMANALKKGKFPATRDALLEMYINGLLSKPSTHVLNIVGNISAYTMSLAERKIAESLGTKSISSGVIAGETRAMIHGTQQGLGRAFRLAAKAIKTGEPSDFMVKTDMFGSGRNQSKSLARHAMSAEELNASGWWGSFLDGVGTSARIPQRLLLASDEFFKAINYDAHIHSLAWRKAHQVAGGRNAREFASTYEAVAKGLDESTHMAAVDFARYNTFTTQLTEGASFHMNKFIKMDPTGLVQGHIPFFQTPVNLMKFGFHRMPLINRLSKQVARDLDPALSDLATQQLAKAKLKMGQGIMALGFGWGMSGRLTGSYPQNRAEARKARNSGWRNHSIALENGYLPINRMDPVAMPFTLAADFAQATQGLMWSLQNLDDAGVWGPEAIERYHEVGSALTYAIYENLSDRNYFAGIADFVDMMESEDKIRAFTKKTATMMPPASFYSGLRRGVRDSFDPYKRDTAAEGLIQELTREMYNGIPYFSQELGQTYDMLGKPKVRNNGFEDTGTLYRTMSSILAPIKQTKRSQSKIENEIVRLRIEGAGTDGPDGVKTIGGVFLEKPEWRAFLAKTWGQEAKELESDLGGAGYRQLGKDNLGQKQREFIQDKLATIRAKAIKKTVKEFPDLETLIDEQADETEENIETKPVFNFLTNN